MVHEGAAQAGMAAQSLIQVHGTTTGDSENLLDTVFSEPVGNTFGKSHVIIGMLVSGFFWGGLLEPWQVDRCRIGGRCFA